ncbi:putative reverse transcriptase domain-containing protein [Tanacetum coccineum]
MKVFPPVSKLDPSMYGPPESDLKEEHIISHLNGMSVQQALDENKLFILDYHDSYLPFLERINAQEGRKAYGTRTVFFLTSGGTLKPIAIELSLPPNDSNIPLKQVLTPPTDATTNWLWQLAKARVCSNDAGVHQLIHHCVTDSVMSSASSAVTYTSVYTDSEPGRVFWGADEELSDGGSPRVIVYGYDGLPMQPVASPSPDYVPGPEHPPSPVEVPYVPEPEYPEYLVPSDDEAPMEDQPLPVDASPVTVSPGYVADSDPEEDSEEDHADYPADGGDDDDEPSDDDDDDDDTGDEDEEPFEDEDEEENLAPADSPAAPVIDPVPSAEDTEVLETDEAAPAHVPSPRRHTARMVQKTVKLEPPMSPSMEARIAEYAATPTPPSPPPSPLSPWTSPLPQIPSPPLHIESLITHHSYHFIFITHLPHIPTSLPLPLSPLPPLPPPPSSLHLPPPVPTSLPLPSFPLPPLPASLFIPPPIDRREDIPEAELPSRKRLCATAPTSRYEVEESSTAAPRPTRGHRADYGFIGTTDAEVRRQRAEEVGYGIRDFWVDPTEAVEEVAPTTLEGVNTRVTELVAVQEQDTHDIYAVIEDGQDRQTQLFQRVGGLVKDRQFHYETARLLDQEDHVSREAWAHSVGLSSANNMPPRRTSAAAARAAAAARVAATAAATPMTAATIEQLIEARVVLKEWLCCHNGSKRLNQCSISATVLWRTKLSFLHATLLGMPITWWNSHMKTVTQDVAYAMDWKALKKMMTVKYCPRGKINKCNMCKKIGHLARDCRSSGPNGNNNNHGNFKTTQNAVTCHECGVQGHLQVETVEVKNGYRGNQCGNAMHQQELGSFDVIIGMDWLSMYHVVIDYAEKIVRIPWGNKTLIVHGDGSYQGNGTRLNIISCTKTHKYLLKGHNVFLAHVTTKQTEDKSGEKRLEDLPIIRDFSEVFPKDLSGLPPIRQVEFQIDLMPGAAPVA